MEGLKSAKNLEKLPPTIGLNIAKITKSEGEFIFWDVGGQKSLRKIWGKYFSECNGVVSFLTAVTRTDLKKLRKSSTAFIPGKCSTTQVYQKFKKQGLPFSTMTWNLEEGLTRTRAYTRYCKNCPYSFF